VTVADLSDKEITEACASERITLEEARAMGAPDRVLISLRKDLERCLCAVRVQIEKEKNA